MNKQQLSIWFRTVAAILIGFGMLYFFVGLKLFSGLMSRETLINWESALYGAIMLGWGVTLFMLGRIAFLRGDAELKRILGIGVAVWLVFEALASAWLGVWFNVGVDVVVAILFIFPLLKRVR